LITTINDVKGPHTKVVVLEDTTTFDESVPQCFAKYPTKVRSCSVPFPNPAHRGLQNAEQSAASATDALYVKTQGWFCTTRCSAVIGTYIPYIDANHVSFAYAQYLQVVMADALNSVL
jgi:hypothetical protein